MLTIIIIILFSILMLWAAYSDFSHYIISNKLCLTVLLLYPVYLLAGYWDGQGLPAQDILISSALAIIIFIVCAGFFALHIMGGGDVKLIAAVALWAGIPHVLHYLFITSVLGGLISAVILVKSRLNKSKFVKSSENINISMTKENESAVPYGIGIAGGGLYVAYQLFVTTTPA